MLGVHFRPCAGAFARRMRSQWRPSSPDASLSGVEVTATSVGWFSHIAGIPATLSPLRDSNSCPSLIFRSREILLWASASTLRLNVNGAVSRRVVIGSDRSSLSREETRGEGWLLRSRADYFVLCPFSLGFFDPSLSSFLFRKGGEVIVRREVVPRLWQAATIRPTRFATKLENYFGASDKLAFIGKRFSWPGKVWRNTPEDGGVDAARWEDGEGAVEVMPVKLHAGGILYNSARPAATKERWSRATCLVQCCVDDRRLLLSDHLEKVRI